MADRRLPALFGAGSFGLGIAGTLAYPASPGMAGEPAAIAAFYRQHADAVLAADVLYLLSGVLLLGFAGYLWAVWRRVEGGDGRIAAMAFGGAIAGSALTIAGAAVDATAAVRVGEREAIDPQVATVLWDLGSGLHNLAAPMAFAVLVLATAVLSARTTLLPSWHAALGGAVGIALLIVSISDLAIIAFDFWVLLTSLLLHLAEPRPPVAATTTT